MKKLPKLGGIPSPSPAHPRPPPRPLRGLPLLAPRRGLGVAALGVAALAVLAVLAALAAVTAIAGLPRDEMGQNPGTPGEPQVIAGIYGCE